MGEWIDFLRSGHSILRYALLLVLIATIIRFFVRWKNKYDFDRDSNRASLVTFILAHTQLLLGLALYFLGSKGVALFSNGMGEVMGNSTLRFFTVEHAFGMLIAIVLISLGRIKAKRLNDDVAKHRTTFIYFLIALVIIIASIPWPFRGFGQAWV